MENTNNIINDEIKPKKICSEHKNAHLKLIMKDIKILKNINKEIEKKPKEHMKKIKNIL